MPSIWDLMPASLWSTQPFFLPPDPAQPSAWPQAASPNWDQSAPTASWPGWSMAPSVPPDALPDADVSVSPWDGAVRRALAAQRGAQQDPDLADAARYGRMFADAKRAHDFAMWAFGPPSAPQASPSRELALHGAPQQYLGDRAQNAVAASAAAPPLVASNPAAPIAAPATVAGAPRPSAPTSGADDLNNPPPPRELAEADQSPALDAATGNPNIERQGERVRATQAAREPPPAWARTAFDRAARVLGVVPYLPIGAFNAVADDGRLTTTPPLQPPAGSWMDDAGGIAFYRDGQRVPWRDVDPEAAKAYYEDQEARANLAPRVALGMLGGGAGFVERGARGVRVIRDASQLRTIKDDAQATEDALRGGGGPRPSPSTSNLKYVEDAPPTAPKDVFVDPKHIADFRAFYGLPDDLQTVAIARTTVPGLENWTIKGGSAAVRRSAGLPPMMEEPYKPATSDFREYGHAEQDVVNQFRRAVDDLRLRPADLDGHVLVIRISNPGGVCRGCRRGLNGQDAAGVLKQLSDDYPGLTIRLETPIRSRNFVVKRGGFHPEGDQ